MSSLTYFLCSPDEFIAAELYDLVEFLPGSQFILKAPPELVEQVIQHRRTQEVSPRNLDSDRLPVGGVLAAWAVVVMRLSGSVCSWVVDGRMAVGA